MHHALFVADPIGVLQNWLEEARAVVAEPNGALTDSDGAGRHPWTISE